MTDESPQMYVRNPDSLVAANSSGTILISPDGSSCYLRNQPDLVCRLLELLREARSKQEIERELLVQFSIVEPLITVLERRKIVVKDTNKKLAEMIPKRHRATTFLCRHIVVGISGTVHAANIIPLLVTIQRMIAKEIDLVLTATAEHFIKPQALSYFDFRVWKDIYETQNGINVPHIHLAASADLVLIAPASAHTIHRLASGACSDLLSLVVSATKAPVIVVPTMNPAMLQFAPIRRNMEILRSCGIYIVEPALGYEVSHGHGDEFRFCGVGLTEANVVRGILAILTAHRTASDLKPTTGAASEGTPIIERVSNLETEDIQEPT